MSCHCRVVTCLCLALAVLAGGRLVAAQLPAESDRELVVLDDKIKQFLEGVSLGQVQTAYQDLLARSQLGKQDKALKDLIDKTKEIETKYGAYHGFEQVSAKRVGKDLVLLRYLYKCEEFPVVWHFAFYRTGSASSSTDEPSPKNDTWRVVIVRFDTDLEALGRD